MDGDRNPERAILYDELELEEARELKSRNTSSTIAFAVGGKEEG